MHLPRWLYISSKASTVPVECPKLECADPAGEAIPADGVVALESHEEVVARGGVGEGAATACEGDDTVASSTIQLQVVGRDCAGPPAVGLHPFAHGAMEVVVAGTTVVVIAAIGGGSDVGVTGPLHPELVVVAQRAVLPDVLHRVTVRCSGLGTS